jgi:hypothetical protein
MVRKAPSFRRMAASTHSLVTEISSSRLTGRQAWRTVFIERSALPMRLCLRISSRAACTPSPRGTTWSTTPMRSSSSAG